jgi:hypothetical protein
MKRQSSWLFQKDNQLVAPPKNVIQNAANGKHNNIGHQ